MNRAAERSRPEDGRRPVRRSANGALVVVVVYPDLLGTYGDGGNGLVLAKRAAWRGIDVELCNVPSGQALPSGDLYCIGGGEDGPQVRAAAGLVADAAFQRSVGGGAVVLGVCAGFQLIGRSFPDARGQRHDGLGLLDVTTVKGTGSRAVGELVAEPTLGAPVLAGNRRLPALIGFENHGGVSTVGPTAHPLAEVVHGVGNGGGDGTEGAWAPRVLGTYLHGPVLSRNPMLADLLLGWATGEAGPLAALDDAEEELVRVERRAAAAQSRTARAWEAGKRIVTGRR